MARLVFAGGEELSFDVDHMSALGVRPAGPVDHWIAAEGLRSVVPLHDKGVDDVTAPEFVGRTRVKVKAGYSAHDI